MSAVLNIAAYHFVALDDTAVLRERLLASAGAAGLRGTVLLAPEGINLFLAGEAAPLRRWLGELRSDPRFAALHAKESRSAAVPFRRLLVKCKAEIIRMNNPQIRPAGGRAPAVSPSTLARWLDAGHDDAGRPVLMLDTRNGFEIEQGRFHGALGLGLERFSDFPAAAQARRAAYAGHTVVSYCTGGIRCEKAALWMAEAGIEHVLQLDGGILAYFEHVGGRHYDGECTVFDDRGAVDAALRPVDAGAASLAERRAAVAAAVVRRPDAAPSGAGTASRLPVTPASADPSTDRLALHDA